MNSSGLGRGIGAALIVVLAGIAAWRIADAGAQSTNTVAIQGRGYTYGPWWVAGWDGGPVPVNPVGPVLPSNLNPCGYNDAGGYSIGGDAGAGTPVVVAQNDGGGNRSYACNLTVNTPNPGGVEVICGPSANACATDGGAGSTQNVLGNYYFSGPGISNNGSPFAYVCPKAGDSMCVFQDGGIGWNSLPGFGP